MKIFLIWKSARALLSLQPLILHSTQLDTTDCLCESSVFYAFRDSSAVEQSAVNRWVAGSNPARGATSSSSG